MRRATSLNQSNDPLQSFPCLDPGRHPGSFPARMTKEQGLLLPRVLACASARGAAIRAHGGFIAPVSILDAGEMDPRIREARLLPFLSQMSDALALITGRPVGGLRLAIESTIFLVVRYAISHDSELARLADVPPAHAGSTSAAALVLIEDHLVEAGLAMLGVPKRS